MGCLTLASILWAYKILHFATESLLWWIHCCRTLGCLTRLQVSVSVMKSLHSAFNNSLFLEHTLQRSCCPSLHTAVNLRFISRVSTHHKQAARCPSAVVNFREQKLPGSLFRTHGVEFWVCTCMTLLFWITLTHSSSVHIRSSYSICSLYTALDTVANLLTSFSSSFSVSRCDFRVTLIHR